MGYFAPKNVLKCKYFRLILCFLHVPIFCLTSELKVVFMYVIHLNVLLLLLAPKMLLFFSICISHGNTSAIFLDVKTELLLMALQLGLHTVDVTHGCPRSVLTVDGDF